LFNKLFQIDKSMGESRFAQVSGIFLLAIGFVGSAISDTIDKKKG